MMSQSRIEAVDILSELTQTEDFSSSKHQRAKIARLKHNNRIIKKSKNN